MSALSGGVFSYGSYEILSSVAYNNLNLEINGYKVTYRQFKTMQADYQRSRFWRKEYAGILTRDGRVIRAPQKYRHEHEVDFEPEWYSHRTNKGVITRYHTHWDAPGKEYYNELGQRMVTSDGPSETDFHAATKTMQFFMNSYLIDAYRGLLYTYNAKTIDCRCFPIGRFSSFFLSSFIL